MMTTPLLDVVYDALASGCLSMAQERRLSQLLDMRSFEDIEIAAVEWLMDALRYGNVRPIA